MQQNGIHWKIATFHVKTTFYLNKKETTLRFGIFMSREANEKYQLTSCSPILFFAKFSFKLWAAATFWGFRERYFHVHSLCGCNSSAGFLVWFMAIVNHASRYLCQHSCIQCEYNMRLFPVLYMSVCPYNNQYTETRSKETDDNPIWLQTWTMYVMSGLHKTCGLIATLHCTATPSKWATENCCVCVWIRHTLNEQQHSFL